MSKIVSMLIMRSFVKQGVRLGFSISGNVFGYGLVIPHHGTIVAGSGNQIGNFCVLHTSTCITNGNKHIGDGMYLSTGAIIVNDVSLGENVSIGANSMINKSLVVSNCMLAGNPAVRIKDSEPWWVRDGEEYRKRHDRCVALYTELFGN